MNKTDEERRCLAEKEFERRAALYKSNPKEFGRETQQLMAEAISNARPEIQARLRGINFVIHHTLARYKDPKARMNKMVELFWNGVDTFDQALHGCLPQPSKIRGTVHSLQGLPLE